MIINLIVNTEKRKNPSGYINEMNETQYINGLLKETVSQDF
jgi:hypothetical protein